MKFEIEIVLMCIVVGLMGILGVYLRLGNIVVYVGAFTLGALMFISFVRHNRR